MLHKHICDRYFSLYDTQTRVLVTYHRAYVAETEFWLHGFFIHGYGVGGLAVLTIGKFSPIEITLTGPAIFGNILTLI